VIPPNSRVQKDILDAQVNPRAACWYGHGAGDLRCCSTPVALSNSARPRQTRRVQNCHECAEQRRRDGRACVFNTLGVAYMNQQKFADGAKNLRQALAADPKKFAVARINLGVALSASKNWSLSRCA